MSFIVALTDAAGTAAVGGKGASLGELTRAGVAVPPGFVVTVDGFTAALAALDPGGELRAELSALPAGDLAAIAAAAARFRARVTGVELPRDVAAAITAGYAALGGGDGAGSGADPGADPGPDVAVRSSATVEDSADASFAGLQDTYLGVSGADAVLSGVRRCWASLYNEESLAYRRRLGMDEADVAMAVVVQQMVAPRAAGVMFTRSPVTGDRSVVAIEGTWGLGSALVSGDVTPDSWTISKITGEVTARRVSPKAKIHRYAPAGAAGQPRQTAPGGQPGAPNDTVAPPGPSGSSSVADDGGGVTVADVPPELRDAPCLTDDEIRALAALARRVEAHYGTPQDIEWAMLDGDGDGDGDPAGRILLLQSRPETVWAARAAVPAGTPRPHPADHVLALFGKPL